MRDNMNVITKGRKGKYVNALENYHFNRINKGNLHMNDTRNRIFEILHELYTR
jgi:hypothetical protein